MECWHLGLLRKVQLNKFASTPPLKKITQYLTAFIAHDATFNLSLVVNLFF
jgi:hypothetical protein